MTAEAEGCDAGRRLWKQKTAMQSKHPAEAEKRETERQFPEAGKEKTSGERTTDYGDRHRETLINSARADAEEKRVLTTALFCRNTLCISRNSD